MSTLDAVILRCEPEALARVWRASKDAHEQDGAASSFEARAKARAPQDDGQMLALV